MENEIINKYITNNLIHWKNVNKNESKLIKIIKKYKLRICKIKLQNGKVYVEKKYNTNGNVKLNKAITFLSDVVKMYQGLNTYIYLNISDTLLHEKINIYNVDGTLGNKKKLNDFVWGTSKSDKDYIRIVESEKINDCNESFPIFCFERNREMTGILFPTFGADNNNFKVSQNIDNFTWDKKTINRPIYRGKNICCDVSNFDKIKLINFSNKYPEDTDFKFCSNKSHPIWGKYMVSESLLKFCQNKNVIDKNVNLKKLRKDYYSQDNFVSFDYLFKHKFIVTVGSAKNRKWYESNSCVLEYKFKNKEFFHEDIFNDMEDIVYFDENNYFEKIRELKKNNYELAKKIVERRKEKFKNYLHYPNLVKWYGKFLLEYQKLLNM